MNLLLEDTVKLMLTSGSRVGVAETNEKKAPKMSHRNTNSFSSLPKNGFSVGYKDKQCHLLLSLLFLCFTRYFLPSQFASPGIKVLGNNERLIFLTDFQTRLIRMIHDCINFIVCIKRSNVSFPSRMMKTGNDLPKNQ